MRFIITLLILAFSNNMLNAVAPNEKNITFPKTYYLIKWEKNMFFHDTPIDNETVVFLGKLEFFEDGGVKIFTLDDNNSYDALMLQYQLDKAIEKDGLEYCSRHFFKPKKAATNDKIFRGYYYNKKPYDGRKYWIKCSNVYFPNINFFKAFENLFLVIDPKIGEKYYHNKWIKDREPYELISALLGNFSRGIIWINDSAGNSEAYTIPYGIKKYAKKQ